MIYTEIEFLERTQLDASTLEIWLREEWLIAQFTDEGRCFTEIDVARVTLISDLQNNMGVNKEGLDVILHLLDQIHSVRRQMSDLLLEIKSKSEKTA